MSGEHRLRSLLDASHAVVEELTLHEVLRRIVDAARELAESDYAALGVISPDGRHEQFVFVGIDEATAERIGHLPRGDGVLGAVIDTGAPIRLDHLSQDPRSVGMPTHHPAMDAFLGVPIRVHDEVFGNLYLANRDGTRFSDEDQELIQALADTAGIAIANARLYDASQRRERWSTALAEVTEVLLNEDADGDGLSVVGDRVASLIDAELVCVLVPSDGAALRVHLARGVGSEGVLERTASAPESIAIRAVEGRAAVPADRLEAGLLAEGSPELGPSVAVPLIAADRVLGVLTLSRAIGAARFTDAELDMASEFGVHASVAIELAKGRADRARLELLDDRSRIARELHDQVIQRLFGTGLGLQALAGAVPEELRDRLLSQVDSIDRAIAEIRTVIFALTAASTRAEGGLRRRLLDVIGEQPIEADATPRLTFAGPVDLLVDRELADDVVAVVRESLANVIRHAGASSSEVAVWVDGEQLRVRVSDDGVGYQPGERSSGTANLAERARRRGGVFRIAPRDDEPGTVVDWSAPIEREPIGMGQ